MMNALHFWHFIIPLPHVCTHKVEDALERGYEILGDVILSIQLPVWIAEKLFRSNTSINKASSWSTSNHNVRDSLAILWLCASILKHTLGTDEGSCRWCTFIRV